MVVSGGEEGERRYYTADVLNFNEDAQRFAAFYDYRMPTFQVALEDKAAVLNYSLERTIGVTSDWDAMRRLQVLYAEEGAGVILGSWGIPAVKVDLARTVDILYRDDPPFI